MKLVCPYMGIHGADMPVYGHIWSWYAPIWAYIYIWSWYARIWAYMKLVCPYMGIHGAGTQAASLSRSLTSQSPALCSDDSQTFDQASQIVTMQPQRNCTDPPGPIFGFHKVEISWIFKMKPPALCSDDSPSYLRASDGKASQAGSNHTPATCCEMAFSRCWPQHQQDHVDGKVLFVVFSRPVQTCCPMSIVMSLFLGKPSVRIY